MGHLYIAHSSRDHKLFQETAHILQSAGFSLWIDPNPQPGHDWRPDIDKAIRRADAVLVLITPNSAQSVYVTYEWTLALALDVLVLPIILKTADLHPRLAALERFDISGWKAPEAFWEYFMHELRARLQPGVPTVPPRPPTQPQRPDMPRADKSVMPPERGHWIVVRRGPNLNQMFRLDKAVMNLGRDDTNDIPIPDTEVSRYHLRFRQHSNGYAVEDLGSTNGTLMDGKRLSGLVNLPRGAVLQLGDSVIVSYEVV